MEGTKSAAHYKAQIHPGGSGSIPLSSDVIRDPSGKPPAAEANFSASGSTVLIPQKEASDEFYAKLASPNLSADARLVQRRQGIRRFCGVSKAITTTWLAVAGGRSHAAGARSRAASGRNHEWRHLYNSDVISMPDKWEYPWYAAWDLAFHCVAMAIIDPDFAKDQLILFLREWYMHPNGQLPAYEWNFSDVNPPVHAWAAWRVYKIEGRVHQGKSDRNFLERVFHKLLLNFTWWVNRKDPEGKKSFPGRLPGPR